MDINITLTIEEAQLLYDLLQLSRDARNYDGESYAQEDALITKIEQATPAD